MLFTLHWLSTRQQIHGAFPGQVSLRCCSVRRDLVFSNHAGTHLRSSCRLADRPSGRRRHHHLSQRGHGGRRLFPQRRKRVLLSSAALARLLWRARRGGSIPGPGSARTGTAGRGAPGPELPDASPFRRLGSGAIPQRLPARLENHRHLLRPRRRHQPLGIVRSPERPPRRARVHGFAGDRQHAVE